MPGDRGTVARRDAGLRRVSRLTRWLVAAALALTAGFSAIAARTPPGTSAKSSGQTGSTATTNGSARSDDDGPSSGDSDSDFGSTFQAPSSPPSASSGPGSVTSGGS
ncbi:MAG TPA: hypothetical protein VE776_01485 [Actinomycetota bacterium]|jgi:hypothetical protein|nr:hypothetical protein [Actinomycetota bacterium]